MRVRESIMLALLGVATVMAGCISSKDGNAENANNALKSQHRDAVKDSKGMFRDVKYPDFALNIDVDEEDLVCPKHPTSNNPNAWKDDQVCLKWKRVKPYPPECMGFGTGHDSLNGCMCAKPPYCWCVWREAAITAACSPDNKTCCNFTSDCIPCGWHELTQEQRDKMHWDFNKKNPPECDDIVKMVNVDHHTEYRACYEWKK